ncbi:Ja103 [Japanese cytomegalovirus]|nr:Ja103 [Japanese cytomegalovirus]
MGSRIEIWYILLIIISCNNIAILKSKTTKTTPDRRLLNLIHNKNPSFRDYAYTLPMPHLPDKNIILAGPIQNTSITYFWYDFYGPFLRKPSNYVMCKYNHTNSSMTLVPPPCGSVPSMKCLSEMINVSLHNDTGEQSCNLTTTFNPMLYNIPRWTTKVYISENIIILDSQSIYFLGLGEVIFRHLLRYNCTKSFYLTNAMSRNLFRLPRVSLWKLKQTMRRLKRRLKPEKNTTQKNKRRSSRSANNTTVTPTPIATTQTTHINTTLNDTETFKLPILITQLQTMITWFYTMLRYDQTPFCKATRDRTRQSAWANHTRQVLYNDTVSSIHGAINLTNLYNTPPPYNTNDTLNSSLFIDPLWDHIDSLVFLEEIRQNNSIDTRIRPTNLSLNILPP